MRCIDHEVLDVNIEAYRLDEVYRQDVSTNNVDDVYPRVLMLDLLEGVESDGKCKNDT